MKTTTRLKKLLYVYVCLRYLHTNRCVCSCINTRTYKPILQLSNSFGNVLTDGRTAEEGTSDVVKEQGSSGRSLSAL